jgi:ABC-2 type transport system permease protein
MTGSSGGPASMGRAPGFLGATLAVTRKELRVYFLSPMAYVFLASFLFLGGLFFYLGVALTGEASLRATMSNLAVALIFCLPLVTMRSFAEEQKAGTLELLMTAPVPLGALILGKWLAVLALCGVLVGATGVYAGILALYGDPDPGVLLTSYLGLVVCCAAFSAAGLFTSTLTRDQMVAGVGAILLLLPFWLSSTVSSYLPAWAAPVLDWVSFLEHLRSFARGVLDTGDIAWFCGFTGVFLFLTWRSIESRRWR